MNWTHAEKTVKKYEAKKAVEMAKSILPPHIQLCLDAMPRDDVLLTMEEFSNLVERLVEDSYSYATLHR